MALFRIIQKNLKLLIRSKSSALIIILGPLLVIFLVGIAFDNVNQYSLKIGTYSESYSPLSESLIDKLVKKDFKITKFSSEEECINKVKKGSTHICIAFPKDMDIANSAQEITFNVDYSKINLIYVIMDTLSAEVGQKTSEISLDLTTTLLNKIDQTKNDIYTLRPDIINLKTDHQKAVEIGKAIVPDMSTMDSKISELSSTSSELRDYFLNKAISAQQDIPDIKTRVQNSNASANQKSYIISLLDGLNTYMFNIQSKIEDVNNAIPVDWKTLTSDIEAINTALNEIKSSLNTNSQNLNAKLNENQPRIDKIQTELDKIYSNLGDIQVTNAQSIVNPIKTSIKPVTTEKTRLNYLFPSLLILVVMFISILLSNTLVMMEKHSPAYFRNFITPTKNIIFILATFLTNLILVGIQILIIIGISYYFFKAELLPNLPITLFILILITTLFTFVGMLIGYLFNSEETSTLAAISTGSVFLFLSSVILPIESMPAYVQKIAQFNPFILGENLLRKSIIFKASISDLFPELYYLLGASVILFLLIWLYQKITRKHLVHHLKYLAYSRFHKKSKAK